MRPTAQTASHEAQDAPERHNDGTANESSEICPETPADQPPPPTTTTTTTTTETGAETSCLGCRRRKLKCSRDLPSCTHCQRLDVACAYDTKKAKPGLRPGAIEALNQRIEVLENALAGRQTISPVPETNANGHTNTTTVVGILALLAQELQKLNAAAAQQVQQVAPATAIGLSPAATTAPRAHGVMHIASPSSTASSPMTAMTANGYGQSGLDSHGHSHRPRKRQRMVDSCGNPDIDLARPLQDLAQDPATPPGLPPPATLQAVVNAYFVAVQPWIPVLHETQFRRRMHDPEQRPQLTCLLHAMVVAAARYVQEGVEGVEGGVDADSGVEAGGADMIDTDALLRLAARSRSHVLLTAMDSLAVENLQALIILAFHDIGSGRTARAWSIVASLTRTVDYLGLDTEAEDDENSSNVTSPNGTKSSGSHKQPEQQQQQQKQKHTLLHPMSLLSPPTNWIEEEERRRVFWCVLLLDRFCSVATGWTTGLAAADVHRRLPADGFFFHKDEPVLTPYMYGAPPSSGGGPPTGDVSRARDREVRDRERERERERDPADPPVRSPASTHVHGHNTNVGALAYCIEAAESLSRVVSTFLRQSVDFGSRPDVSRWLTRFKELDLQLVHWKMYLPQRWRDSNVSRQPALVNMDPNLTLAHITHNTSTILLHQRIAYPDAAWWAQWTSMVKVKLPSVCSAETCQNAAIETAAITSKYLRFTPKHRPVASQFAFCVYISARVLLLHGRSEVGREVSSSGMTNGPTSGDAADVDVLPEFFSLLRSLEDMDRRWLGSSSRFDQDASKKSISLAGHYAQHLKDLYRQCLASPSFVVDVLGYTEFEPDAPAVSEPVPEPAPPATPSPPAPLSDPAPTHPQQQPQQQLAAVHPSMHTTMNQPNPASTWPMQPLDQLSPVMTYHQHAAQAHAMADNSASAYAAAASVVSVPTGHTGHTDDLAAISHLLLDQQFMDRDRVISFEDSFLAAPGRWT